ncbi:eukaryotic translation initiation factor 1A (macronuclear) [Tetrahymena thermophila SB210]|uniref:Eukaryotic translation initiation factor 4C n=1 Tax=Tetrahymena thermophila (strain SB210) TaxID=312017 RepID=I7MK25_TETTS|nr:eukaryotic translation initiation factor 1A [Tetrahymena thermophila SB210]EAS07745.3 eukaryotic translation initiation factor 1A [Tetrahymena thermophila SB210]|eukprot:XP_001027987.3 eukaryotic translation initiation factor 1A [Tetrahymena thermophila SB210]
MPKNKGRGGKNYRRGKNENETKRELVFKEEGMEYAQVIKMLGNGRLEVFCFDGKRRIGHICGRLKKKVWISMDDIVLVGLRDFQDDKCDILLKYLPDEVRNLKQYGEIDENIKINDKSGADQADVVFEDSDSDDKDDDDDDEDEQPTRQTNTRVNQMVESSDEEDNKETGNYEEQKYDQKHQNKKDDIDIDDI